MVGAQEAAIILMIGLGSVAFWFVIVWLAVAAYRGKFSSEDD
jgi:hypothetical protein